MLLILIYFLQKLGVKTPAVFSYFSTRMILASITCLLITIFLGPCFIRKLYALKLGQPIRSGKGFDVLSELHHKKKDTPTMGGILILSAMFISLLLWMDLTSAFTWIILITTIVLGGLGAVDDYLKLKYKNSKGLKSRRKFFVQIVFSALISSYLLSGAFQERVEHVTYLKAPIAKQFTESKIKTFSMKEYMTKFYVPFCKKPIFSFRGWGLLILFFVMLLVISGSSNAVNLTDGLDGLAAGCLVMVSITLAIFSFLSNHIELSKYLNILYIEGSGEIAVYLFAMAGACLGFLWYNGYPAQVFMGDTGSIGLGGILGVSSILIRRELLLALAGIIFVIETLSVIIQVLSFRFRNKKRVFLCTPLHHHFEYKGWPETKIVLRFWIVSLFFAIIAVASLKFQ